MISRRDVWADKDCGHRISPLFGIAVDDKDEQEANGLDFGKVSMIARRNMSGVLEWTDQIYCTSYTEVLRQMLERLTHIRDVIKKWGFAMAVTEVAANGEGALEFMSVLQAKPDAIRTDNAAVCIDSLQFGFEKDPELGVNELWITYWGVWEGRFRL
jgi:hypothetical protein